MHTRQPLLVAAFIGHMALGLNNEGAQLRWQFASPLAVEARWQHAEENADTGRVHTNVFSARGYWTFQKSARLTPYLGLESGYVKSTTTDNLEYKSTGLVEGGFAGLEWRFAPRFSFAVDAGPYFYTLREKQTQIKNTDWDFTLNAGVLWYVF